MSIIKKFSVFMLLLLLSSCQRQYSYTYLTQHPNVLKNEIEKCQSNTRNSSDTIYCDRVMNAASVISAIINEQQISPEAFGQKILTAELTCTQTRIALVQAQKELQNLKTQKATETDIKAAEQKVADLKQQQQTQSDETKMLLAVAGLNSPE